MYWGGRRSRLVNKQSSSPRSRHKVVPTLQAHSAASHRPRHTHAATMIDYARPMYDANAMCEFYLPSSTTAPDRLADFEVFKRGAASHIYGNYYANLNYDSYAEPEIDSAMSVYHNMISPREHYRDDWKYKMVEEWNEDDTVCWIIDIVQSLGISELAVPFNYFRVTGIELRSMRREELFQRLSHQNTDISLSRRLTDIIYERLHNPLNEETVRQSSIIKYGSDSYQHQESAPTLTNLDLCDNKNRHYPSEYKQQSLFLQTCDSSDDTEDLLRSSGTASPDSDGSKSGDDDEDKRKMVKRPPGRPKGSGRKVGNKRPRSVSVPEFLRNLLWDPKYCPSIIKWEDHALGKFRFVKPDEVAKLWGNMKQNNNMTFEKFSRAMRYHYRQSVLVSVPTARLVYQFGNKGPDFKTDNPNFIKVKSELEDLSYS